MVKKALGEILLNHGVFVASLIVCLSALMAAAAAGRQAARRYTPPQTAGGDPDLQGSWTNTTTTPLERPDDLGDKEVLTGEEWAARNAVSGLSDDRPLTRSGSTTTSGSSKDS